MRISVGPAPGSWGEEKLLQFYREIAQSPVDDVYLGEVVCPKRSCLSPEFVNRVSGELLSAGKVIYLSSPALVTEDRERCEFDDLSRRVKQIEINSPAFLAMSRSSSAVAGAFLNVYNSSTARALASLGITRVVPPSEISFDSLGTMIERCTVSMEVVVHGYIPLALSRQCLTVRALTRNTRGCGMACRDYPEGMVLQADGRSLFRVDGPLTLSASTYCLVEYLPWLERLGVECVRIHPQWEHTGQIVSIYRSVLHRRRGASQALKDLAELSPDGICNGWFLGKAGWIYESPN